MTRGGNRIGQRKKLNSNLILTTAPPILQGILELRQPFRHASNSGNWTLTHQLVKERVVPSGNLMLPVARKLSLVEAMPHVKLSCELKQPPFQTGGEMGEQAVPRRLWAAYPTVCHRALDQREFSHLQNGDNNPTYPHRGESRPLFLREKCPLNKPQYEAGLRDTSIVICEAYCLTQK